MKRFYDISLKTRMNFTIILMLVIVISSLGIYLYRQQRRIIMKEADESLYSQLDDLCAILQTQLSEKQKNATTSLSMLHNLFYANGNFTESSKNSITLVIRNQQNDDIQEIKMAPLLFNNRPLYNNNQIVDQLKKIGGEAATVFQRIPQGFVRISTSITDTLGNRAVDTYIPQSSPVAKAIEQGHPYTGRAFVVDDWYVTSYEPIYINKRVSGMLFAGIKEKDKKLLKQIFTNKKYYDFGYPYLVDINGLLVIHPKQEGSNIKEHIPFKQIMDEKGKTGKSRYFWPEDQSGSWKWQYFKYFAPYQAYVCVTVYEKDLFASIIKVRNIITTGVLFSIIIFYLGISLLIKPITNTIDKSVAFAHELAHGNLMADIDIEQKDELGKLADALRKMSSKLKDIVSSIQSGAGNIASASTQLSAGAQQLSQGANQQASSTEEVSSSMEEILSNIEQNTDNAVQTQKIAIEMNDSIRECRQASQSVILSMTSIAEKIDIINDIAYQTNILALNAAVEAARAGDYGKGFAVVASEVRKLAERSRLAALEINELSRNGVQTSQEAGKKLEYAIPEIQKTAQLVQEIATGSMEQNSGVEQINTSIQQLNQATQQNAAISEELATSAEELSSQAEQLKEAVAFFKINGSSIHKPKPQAVQQPGNNLPVESESVDSEVVNGKYSGITVNLIDPAELVKESDYEKY